MPRVSLPPDFYRYTPEAIGEFFRLFAIAVGGALPILLYNIPAFTNAIPIELARELLTSGDFAGIKDSSGDPEYLGALLAIETPQPLSILCGNDRLLAEALRSGVSGAVSGVACAVPELMLALLHAIRSKDDAAVGQLESEVNAFIEWIDQFPVPVGITAACEARGDRVGPPAIPLNATQFESLEEFKNWFASWLPFVLNLHARSLT